MSTSYKRDPIGKGYREIVFLPNPSQSAEMNDLQEIYNYNREKFMSTIYPDGYIIKGGFLSISGNTEVIFTDTLTTIRGQMFELPEDRVTILGEGEESIGFFLRIEEISSLEDPELLNPAEGTATYNSSGSNRMRYSLSWSLPPDTLEDNEYFYPVYRFSDSVLQNISELSADDSSLMRILSRYDYTSNGNFIVEGMTLFHDSDSQNDDYHRIGVREGYARVEGKEVTFPYSRFINIRKANDTNSRDSEPITFTGDGSYPVRHAPIAEVTRIQGIYEVTDNITHAASTDSRDVVPNTPLINIIEVKQGSVTYKENIDYVQNGDYIDWSPRGAEPSPGSTYTVKYRYQSLSIPYEISEDRSSISVSGLAENTVFFIDYSHYLDRMDKIVLLSSGELTKIEGIPSEYNPTPLNPSEGLVLSTVYVRYNLSPYFYNDTFRTVNTADQYAMQRDIDDIRYNIARLSLSDDISASDPTSLKKSQFVDPFLNNNLRDLGIEQSSVISNQALGPKVDWNTVLLRSGKNICINGDNVLFVSQNHRTKSRLINEFLVLTEGATIEVSPFDRKWIEDFQKHEFYGPEETEWLEEELVAESKPVPQYDINIMGGPFGNSEQLEIYIDDKKVGGDFRSGSNGSINITMKTPESMMSGSKKIMIRGTNSGIEAESQFSANPVIQHQYVVKNPPPTVINNITNITQSVVSIGGIIRDADPLGQTVPINESIQISGIHIMFRVRPTTNPFILMQETIAGLPDVNRTLVDVKIDKNDIILDRDHFIEFPNPIQVSVGSLYAFIVGCSDGVGEIYVAELGKMDLRTKEFVTQNPFPAGTLIQASQLRTWSVIQSEDMYFGLYKKEYPVGTHNIELGETTVTNCTDLSVISSTLIYPETSINYNLHLIGRNEVINIDPFDSKPIDKYTGVIKVTADLTTNNANVSPQIQGDVQIAWGEVRYPASYVSRQFSAHGGSTIKVYLQTFETGDSSIKVYYQDGDNWIELERDILKYPPVGLGSGWFDYTWEKVGISVENTRIKIEMNSLSTSLRPFCSSLRAVFV